jgi:monovalent cation:H+ antiporter-2, CPA2 family
MASIVDTAPLVLDVGVVLMAAATSGLIARRVGLPAIVGYLLTGLLVSPFTPGFVADKNQLALLADIGVVLLLFEVGIEIDLKRIRRDHNSLLWAAPTQLLVGLAVGTPIFLLLDLSILGSLLLSLSLAMSSSVVIVNITRSRRRKTNTETEELLLGWSVLQDLVGVAAAAIVLTLFGNSEKPLLESIGGLVGFVLFAILCAKVLPGLLKLVRWEKDLFLIYSVAIGLSIAALGTVLFDIPMALASFVAGLSITQSRDTDEVRKAVLPFKDLFQVLFFVVVGSLVNPDLAIEALPFAAILLIMMFALKTLPIYLLSRLGKLKANRTQLSVGLSQIGEFSFVLGGAALAAGAITETQFTGVLIAVIASIIFSTLSVRWSGHRASRSI